MSAFGVYAGKNYCLPHHTQILENPNAFGEATSAPSSTTTPAPVAKQMPQVQVTPKVGTDAPKVVQFPVKTAATPPKVVIPTKTSAVTSVPKPVPKEEPKQEVPQITEEPKEDTTSIIESIKTEILGEAENILSGYVGNTIYITILWNSFTTIASLEILRDSTFATLLKVFEDVCSSDNVKNNLPVRNVEIHNRSHVDSQVEIVDSNLVYYGDYSKSNDGLPTEETLKSVLLNSVPQVENKVETKEEPVVEEKKEETQVVEENKETTQAVVDPVLRQELIDSITNDIIPEAQNILSDLLGQSVTLSILWDSFNNLNGIETLRDDAFAVLLKVFEDKKVNINSIQIENIQGIKVNSLMRIFNFFKELKLKRKDWKLKKLVCIIMVYLMQE